MSSKLSSPHGGLAVSSLKKSSGKKTNPALSPRTPGRKAKDVAKQRLFKTKAAPPKLKRSVSQRSNSSSDDDSSSDDSSDDSSDVEHSNVSDSSTREGADSMSGKRAKSPKVKGTPKAKGPKAQGQKEPEEPEGADGSEEGKVVEEPEKAKTSEPKGRKSPSKPKSVGDSEEGKVVEEPEKAKTPEPKERKLPSKAKERQSSEEPDGTDNSSESRKSDVENEVVEEPEKVKTPDKPKGSKTLGVEATVVGATQYPVKSMEEFKKRRSSQLEDQVAAIRKEKEAMREHELELDRKRQKLESRLAEEKSTARKQLEEYNKKQARIESYKEQLALLEDKEESFVWLDGVFVPMTVFANEPDFAEIRAETLKAREVNPTYHRQKDGSFKPDYSPRPVLEPVKAYIRGAVPNNDEKSLKGVARDVKRDDAKNEKKVSWSNKSDDDDDDGNESIGLTTQEGSKIRDKAKKEMNQFLSTMNISGHKLPFRKGDDVHLLLKLLNTLYKSVEAKIVWEDFLLALRLNHVFSHTSENADWALKHLNETKQGHAGD